MQKGQFSIEFIIVLGVLLVIISTVSLPLYSNSRDSVEEIKGMSLARNAANKLAYSINMVYVEGPGAKKTVEYTLPEGIENIKISNSEDYENYAEVLIHSSGWVDDNSVSVKTLLSSGNRLAVVFVNPENITSQGDHKVRVINELDPVPKIKIEEV